MSFPPGRLLGFLLEAHVCISFLAFNWMGKEEILNSAATQVVPRCGDPETISHLLKDKRWSKMFSYTICHFGKDTLKSTCVWCLGVLTNLFYLKLFLRELKILKWERPPLPLFPRGRKLGSKGTKRGARGLRTGSWQNKGSALSMKRSKPWNVRTARLRPIVSYLSDLPEVYKAP